LRHYSKVKVDEGDAVAAGQLAAHAVGVWWGTVHNTRHAVHQTIRLLIISSRFFIELVNLHHVTPRFYELECII